jgi:hypothetical protein
MAGSRQYTLAPVQGLPHIALILGSILEHFSSLATDTRHNSELLGISSEVSLTQCSLKAEGNAAICQGGPLPLGTGIFQSLLAEEVARPCSVQKDQHANLAPRKWCQYGTLMEYGLGPSRAVLPWTW